MAPPISWKSGGFSLSGSASVGGLTSASAPEPRSRQLGRTFTGRPLGDAGAPASSTFGKNSRGRVSGASESQMSASVGSGASRDAASAPFDSRALAHTSARDPETNTWRYIGAATANPSVRAQSGSLLRAFDVAMAAVEKGASAMEGDARSGPGGDDAKELTATVLGELFSVKSEVAAHFAQRATLERCIAFAAGKLAEDPGAAFLPAPPEVGLSERTWSLQKEGLASIWCEQKWTDLITGKLQDQAGAVSVEFGSLVRKLRHRNASLVDRALKLHSDALWQLEASAASVVALREAALRPRVQARVGRVRHGGREAAERRALRRGAGRGAGAAVLLLGPVREPGRGGARGDAEHDGVLPGQVGRRVEHGAGDRERVAHGRELEEARRVRERSGNKVRLRGWVPGRRV